MHAKVTGELTSRIGCYGEGCSPVLVRVEEVIRFFGGGTAGPELRAHNHVQMLEIRYCLSVSAMQELTAERTVEGREATEHSFASHAAYVFGAGRRKVLRRTNLAKIFRRHDETLEEAMIRRVYAEALGYKMGVEHSSQTFRCYSDGGC